MTVDEEIAIISRVGWADVYQQEHVGLVRLARLIVGSPALAEELVHDAFIAAICRSNTIDNPGAYVRKIVVNNCRSSLRRSSTRRRKIAQLESQAAADLGAHMQLEPELDETWQALDCVTTKQRTALALRFYLDLPILEIAEIMGERPGTVKSLIHRGLATLRKEMSP